MESKSKKLTAGRAFLWIAIAVLVGGLAGGAFGYSYGRSCSRQAEEQAARPADYRIADNGYTGSSAQGLLDTPIISDQVETATRAVQDSVVVITTKVQAEVQTLFGQSYVQEYSALGSGVLFREEKDRICILTNAHVLEDASEAYLYINEETSIPVYLVGESVSNDLAVIYVRKADVPSDILAKMKIAEFGDSDALRKGDLAVAIGSPYSKSMDHTTTVGIVTGVNQKLAIDGRVMTVIQTDASLNPGNSGGALVNAEGKVIGINSAGIRDGVVKGMGFAIAINPAREVIEDLLENGSPVKTSIGLDSYLYIDEDAGELYRLPKGVYIYEVTPGGPAEKAGIRKGDMIVSINGVELTDRNTLDDILASLKGGDTVTAGVVRSRNTRTTESVQVTLDSVSDTNTNIATEPDTALSPAA